MTTPSERDGFGPGLIYEDCAYHPVLCVSLDADDLAGISLIDGSSPRGCSLSHCGPVPLSIAEAAWIKAHFVEYVAARESGQEPRAIVP